MWNCRLIVIFAADAFFCISAAKICSVNEVYNKCANSGCQHWDCSALGGAKLCKDPYKCVGDCLCKEGYLRGKEGKCIPENECSKNLCPKENEVYDMCPVDCPARNCDVDDRNVKCNNNQMCGLETCRCRDGTFRNSDGNCVLWEDCRKKSNA